jgi:hypothetical protein
MSATLDEVRKEIKATRDRIKIVRSDQERDVKRVTEEHWRWLRPAAERLRRLREKYRRAHELIAEYEHLIDERSRELGMCKNERVKKLLSLIRKINGLTRKSDKAVMLKRLTLGNERARSLQFVIGGYENEIKYIKKLVSGEGAAFLKVEKNLTTAIEAHCKSFEQFLRNAVNGDDIVNSCFDRLEQLRKQERELGGDKRVQQLNKKASELMELIKGLPPDVLRAVLKKI